jgi:hypothetical protein
VVGFDDDHAVANAGLLPATLAERLGIEASSICVSSTGTSGRCRRVYRPRFGDRHGRVGERRL